MQIVTEQQARAAYIAFIAAPEPNDTTATTRFPNGATATITTTTYYPPWDELDNESKQLWFDVATAVVNATDTRINNPPPAA